MQKLINPKFLYKHNPTFVIGAWERLKPFVLGYRETSDNPKHFDAFEWLANLMREMIEEERKGEPIKTHKEILDERDKRIEMLREKRRKGHRLL